MMDLTMALQELDQRIDKIQRDIQELRTYNRNMSFWQRVFIGPDRKLLKMLENRKAEYEEVKAYTQWQIEEGEVNPQPGQVQNRRPLQSQEPGCK